MRESLVNQQPRTEDRDAEFLSLLGRYELPLSAYIHVIAPVWQDAEDILQETKITLWREFAVFKPGTDFLAWARAVARNRARTIQRQKQRRHVIFDDRVIDLLLEDLAQTSLDEDRRREAMLECGKRMNQESWDLFYRCYGQGQKIKDIAAKLGRSVNGTYGMLSRLRRRLADCMEERLRRKDDA